MSDGNGMAVKNDDGEGIGWVTARTDGSFSGVNAEGLVVAESSDLLTAINAVRIDAGLSVLDTP